MRQLRLVESLREGCFLLAGLGVEVHEAGLRSAGAQQEQVVQALGERLADALDGQPLRDQLVAARQGRRRVPIGDRLDQSGQPLARGDPQKVLEQGACQVRLAAGQQAVQQAQRIAHRAVAQTRHTRDQVGVGGDPLFLEDPADLLGDPVRRDRAEVVALASAADRRQQLLRLGRAQDEHHMLGRLLQRLEQGVEGLTREHVDLVDDVDLATGPQGAVGGVGDQIAGLVDAPVRRRVDLDDIAVFPAHDRLIDGVVRAALGVARDGDGKEAGGGGLAHPARPTEQIGVRNPPLLDGTDQRAGDRLLSDELVEGLRAVSSCQDGVRHRSGW